MTGSLPGLLLDAAVRYGDRTGLAVDEGPLTYHQLAERVNVLAARLRSAGVVPGERVGLCVSRGPLSLLGSAALMRLRCAYVPLQMGQGQERTRHIVRNAGLGWVICDEAGRAELAPFSLRTVSVSPVDLLSADSGPSAVLPDPRPDDPAYIIHTSGSTGVPKGVEISHRNVLALLSDALPRFSFGPDEVWPMMHGDGFDVSVWERWAAVACGATLIPVPEQAIRDPALLADLLVRWQATRLHIVPSIFRQLAEVAAETGMQIPLRNVTFAGEAISYPSIVSWMNSQTGPRPQWFNAYGITETTIYNTLKELAPHDISAANSATPIGAAFRNSPVILLDDALRESPPGETGEIFIGGAQVASGYLNDPAMTAARFLSLPGRDGRWYRTGDLAFKNELGELFYVGRTDDQVKIRGNRIELGEVDHALRSLPWVRDGATIVHQNSRGEPVLVALLVLRDAAADNDRAALRKLWIELSEKLPPAMLPNRVVCVDQLPLNGSGKADRRAMAAMAARSQTGE
jgi:amino acid adenylation domain-containing protein